MVTANLSVTPAAPKPGDTVTATYTVTGNDPGPARQATVNGTVQVGTDPAITVTATVTLPGTPAKPVTYEVPTCPGLTFTPTGDPRVFTAKVP